MEINTHKTRVRKKKSTSIYQMLWKNYCCCLVTKSCPMLCNPIDSSSPGSFVHGILQARILEWVAISSPKFPTEGLNPCLLNWQEGSSLLSHRKTLKNLCRVPKTHFVLKIIKAIKTLWKWLNRNMRSITMWTRTWKMRGATHDKGR